jgi:hypothetical protein
LIKDKTLYFILYLCKHYYSNIFIGGSKILNQTKKDASSPNVFLTYILYKSIRDTKPTSTPEVSVFPVPSRIDKAGTQVLFQNYTTPSSSPDNQHWYMTIRQFPLQELLLFGKMTMSASPFSFHYTPFTFQIQCTVESLS